jgi:N-acetylglucosaminyl-diphospho-decaprenol L-rhamnosyltransferase
MQARREEQHAEHRCADDECELVRERFPEAALVEEENRGLAFGWNTGIERTAGRYVLLLNADAWLDPGSLDALVAFADARPDAAVVGPRLRFPDGRLQRSVRGFPTLWRLATEFLFLRRLAPGTRALNAFYGAGFDHGEVLEAEVVMGAVWLVRRAAIEEVGPADDAFFLFSEETDWAYRFREAGWKIVFFPGAGATHVYAASHKGQLFVENLRGQLRFLRKHRGEAYAERARELLLLALRLRGALYRGERGRMSRDGAAWLASGRVGELLR